MGRSIITSNQWIPEVNTDINVKYAIGLPMVKALKNFLNKKSIDATFLYNNQSEYVQSLRVYPFSVWKFFRYMQPYKEIEIGPFKFVDTLMKGYKCDTQYNSVFFGSYHFNRYFNNFMDFSPYTKIQIYLPYLSFVDLSTNEVMGKTIDIYCRVDFDNGILHYYIITRENDTLIATFTANVGIDITLSQTNGTELSRNRFIWGLQSVASIGSVYGAKEESRMGKAVSAGFSTGINFINANQEHVRRGNIGSGGNLLITPTNAYVSIIRPVPEPIDITYASTKGFPLEQTRNLATLHGFTIVGNIHLDGFNCTESELNEIDNLLRAGVIL